jgi:hypothetical protein
MMTFYFKHFYHYFDNFKGIFQIMYWFMIQEDIAQKSKI